MPRITDHAFVGSDLQPAHARDLCLVCDGKRDAHEREQPAREDCDRCGEHRAGARTVRCKNEVRS